MCDTPTVVHKSRDQASSTSTIRSKERSTGHWVLVVVPTLNSVTSPDYCNVQEILADLQKRQQGWVQYTYDLEGLQSIFQQLHRRVKRYGHAMVHDHVMIRCLEEDLATIQSEYPEILEENFIEIKHGEFSS